MTWTQMAAGAGAALLIVAGSWSPLACILARRGLTRINYRGVTVPTGVGLVLLPAVLPLVSLLSLLGRGPEAAAILAATWGMGLAGFLDDLSRDGSRARGWRGHLRALTRLTMTGGGRKLVVGGAAAAAAAAVVAPGPVRWLLGVAAVGLGANTLNQLDLRPGRAWKAFLLVAWIPAALARGGPASAAFLAATAAASALLRPELDERFMLGDAGANAVGGLLGCLLLLSLPTPALGVSVLILVVAQLYMEARSLDALIRRHGLLRRLDDWGLGPFR